MTYIGDLPDEIGNAGLEFNYAVWPGDTRVTLTNVPWDNSYRDVVKFESRDALNAYLDGENRANIYVNDASYIKTNEPIYLDVPFNTANKFNYLRASNPAAPDQRDFYYFILGVEYVAPNNTRFVVQLDVWQSFIDEETIGNVFVEQGHVGIANENSFIDYGLTNLTIPEGIDIGNEYLVIDNKNIKYMASQAFDNDGLNFYTAVVSSINWATSSFGTITDPKMDSAIGGMPDGLPSGAALYLVDGSPQSLMQGLSPYPWITQGILAMYAIPKIDKLFNLSLSKVNTPISGLDVYQLSNTTRSQSYRWSETYANWRESNAIRTYLGSRYRHLKKFLTAPYCVIELTDHMGKSITLNPESWADDNATLYERMQVGSPNPRINVSPWRYNKYRLSPNIMEDGDRRPVADGGDSINAGITIDQFPTFSVVNDNALLAQAKTAHSVRAQKDALGWSQSKALQGNQLSYDQATMGINTANSMTDLANSTAAAVTGQQNAYGTQQTMHKNITGIIGGAAIGGATGGVAGAAVGALGGAMSAVNNSLVNNMAIDNNNAMLAITQANNSASNRISGQQAEYVRDTNKSLADYAAKGDYAHSIAAMNAATRDLETTPPGQQGNVGGETLSFIHGGVRLFMKIKMIGTSAKNVIGEYWLRYGYSVNRFMKFPGYHAMSKFTYWRMSETYIQANIPESYKTSIRGIFEKGVTIWRNPADIGRIDTAANQPIEGIKY